MKIITSITPKGGPGKTTLLYSYAKYRHDQGKKVLIVDFDENFSLTNMYERRIEFLEANEVEDIDFPTVLNLQPSKAMLERQIRDLGKDYDEVLIDTAGKIERYHRDLCLFVDLVLIPVRPVQASIDNAIATCEYLDDVREENDNMPVYGIAALGFKKNGVEDREYLREFDDSVRFTKQTEYADKAYKVSDRRGLSITELDKCELLSRKDREAAAKAAIQMRLLCKEISELVEAI